MAKKQIHIAHVVYSFATGGLENGVVNLINSLPKGCYRHTVLCVSDHDANFVKRIVHDEVDVIDLHKKAGKSITWLFKCWSVFRSIKPDVLHTRNMSALEAQIPGLLAGIKHRVHGEHGWDVRDIAGKNSKYQRFRKLFRPLVHQYIALSNEGVAYLSNDIEVQPKRINHICNGVDIDKFNQSPTTISYPTNFCDTSGVVFGTVGRLAQVKNQTFLLDAFIALKKSKVDGAEQAKLIIVGDGMLMTELSKRVESSGLENDIWLTGLRSDIPELMNAMDVFVLPSLAEGISNTILEAMASGLPVIATNVGGNPDLIMESHQATHLINVGDVDGLSKAMAQYLCDSERLQKDSKLARTHCVGKFSIQSMVDQYHDLYQTMFRKVYKQKLGSN